MYERCSLGANRLRRLEMTNPLIVTNSKSTIILTSASAGSFMGWGVRIG
jgi:hypothetical protein